MENNQHNPKVTAAIDEINKNFEALAQEGNAVFQRENLDNIHLPVLVYGKMYKMDSYNEEKQTTETVYKYNEKAPLSYNYFTGGDALIGMQAMGDDPRFMSAREAFERSDVKIKKGAKPITMIMQNKKTHQGYVAKFYNLADLKGPAIIRHDVNSVINERRDEIAKEMLKEVNTNGGSKKLYGVAHFAYQSAVATIEVAHSAEDQANKAANLDKLAEAKAPYTEKFNERLAAINCFDKPVTAGSLPQDKFISYMKETIEQNALEATYGGKQKNYVMDAAERLFAENVPMSQVKACIKNFAPEAVYDPAKKQVFGEKSQSYADYIAPRAQKNAREASKANAAVH